MLGKNILFVKLLKLQPVLGCPSIFVENITE